MNEVLPLINKLKLHLQITINLNLVYTWTIVGQGSKKTNVEVRIESS